MAAPNRTAVDDTENWPAPTPDQVQVCLLGCYHMDNPGLDAVDVEADDVLADRRQREIADLVDGLASWAPDRVAVEQPADAAAEIDEAYAEFRNGERSFDEPADDLPLPVRSEVVQVGFRLAAALDHERVAPVDDRLRVADRLDGSRVANLDRGDLWIADEELRDALDLAGPEAYEERASARLAESTVTEYIRWLNTEEELRTGQRGMFAGAIPRDQGDPPLGGVALGVWYERNIRVVQHLWNALEDDERAMVLFGAGHVAPLRHLLDETPMFSPVSPLPLL